MLKSTHLDALTPHFRRLIEQLVRELNRASPPVRTWVHIVSRGPGGSQTQTEERIDFRRLRLRAILNASEMPTYRELLDAAGKLPDADELFRDADGKVVEPPRRDGWLWNAGVGAVVGTYFRDPEHPLEYDEQLVDLAVQDVIADRRGERRRYRMLRPLLNLALERDVVQISDEVALRTIPNELVEEWLNPDSPSEIRLPQDTILALFTMLECTYETVGNDPAAESRATGILDEVLPLLQLLADCDARAPFTETRLVHQRGEFVVGKHHPYFSHAHGEQGRLAAGDVERLRLLLQRKRDRDSPRLRLALRRWADAAGRTEAADRVIDYWVGLESLFTPDAMGELTYRASLRIAAYLGETGAERVQLHRDAKDSYGIRSKLVHGDEVNVNLDAAAHTARQFLRRSLLRLLESEESFEPKDAEVKLLSR